MLVMREVICKLLRQFKRTYGAASQALKVSSGTLLIADLLFVNKPFKMSVISLKLVYFFDETVYYGKHAYEYDQRSSTAQPSNQQQANLFKISNL